MTNEALAATRRTLHGVGEMLIAGPQYRDKGTIKLRVIEGGFTAFEQGPTVQFDELIVGDARYAIANTTYRGLAESAGIQLRELSDVYGGGPQIDPGEELITHKDSAATICGALWAGQQALEAFGETQTPILWPEHFDVGITIDEVNYGVSPGDGFCDGPYAYVGPHEARSGEFWNAPFGAFQPILDVGNVEAIAAFFVTGRAQANE